MHFGCANSAPDEFCEKRVDANCKKRTQYREHKLLQLATIGNWASGKDCAIVIELFVCVCV